MRLVDIEGFPGYMVSDEGDVFSRLVQGHRIISDEIQRKLSPGVRSDGRHLVSLRKDRGQRVTRLVSHLVLEAFKGPRPPGMEASHQNGRCWDDRAENLEWETPLDNHAKKVEYGTLLKGLSAPNCTFVKEDILAIREHLQRGFSQYEIAKIFNTHQSVVSNIHLGKTYADVR